MWWEECPWLKSHRERESIGEDIDKNVLTNEICSWFETDQPQNFALLCMLWVLPSKLIPRVLLGIHLRLHLGLDVCPWSIRVKDEPPLLG